MGIPISVVDAFSDRPFRGNPAAVCLPPGEVTAEWMQSVAAEMNLAETAFLQPRGPGEFELRWFTPAVEVDLCGHATLASAHRLWEEGLAGAAAIRFHTRSGLLTATRVEDEIELDFPAAAPRESPPPPDLAGALGAPILWCGVNALDVLVVELADERAVRNLEPDFAALSRVSALGVVATATAARPDETGYEFVSRFFAPRLGIDEDPVTGSAHCALAPFWAARLGRLQLVGWQASARGGLVRTRLAGDRVFLGGRAVTVWKGEFLPLVEKEGT